METIRGKYTIRQIFNDHWKNYLACHPNQPEHVLENVEKMLICRNPEALGYRKVACPDHPDAFTVIPHSCKSRFCNSCGKVAVDKWLVSACQSFPNVPYSHLTFTVPSELRPLLQRRPEYRKLLFKVSSRIILEWARDRGWTPAIVSVLHTFGRDLKFHPHIHMLVSGGGLDVVTKRHWIPCSFLPEGMLKARWRAKLLYALYGERLISHRLKRLLFTMKWFVHVAASLMLPVVTTNYIGRYTKRPPLAEARIERYDGHIIAFNFSDWYLDKAKNYRVVQAVEFIGLLVQHIPLKHSRLIVRYGLLAGIHVKQYQEVLHKLFGSIQVVKAVPQWRTRQSEYRGLDPLLCPICQKEMVIVEAAYWSKKQNKLIVTSC